MKVLAHVPPIREALAELARLVRPGGHLLLEFYNPWSLRYLAKRLGGPGTHRRRHHRERRLHPLRHRGPGPRLPAGRVELVGVRGVRVVTPASSVYRFAAARPAVRPGRARRLRPAAGLRNLGGFLILVARKRN